MTLNVYQMWLKKSEFKAPRLPPSPTAAPAISSTFTTVQKLPQVSKSHDTSRAKFYVETIRKSAARPLAATTRPRGLIKPEGTEHTEQLDANCFADVVMGTEAQAARQVEDKGAELKQQVMALKWINSLNETSPSSERSREERLKSMKQDATCRSGEEIDEKQPTRSKNYSMQLQQMRKRKIEADATLDRTTKRLRFEGNTKEDGVVGLDGVKSVGQVQSSFSHQDAKKTRRTLVKSDDCTTMTRLWYCGGNAEEKKKDVKFSGLPPKSPIKPKQGNATISVLDESQYWMAVERFSHLA